MSEPFDAIQKRLLEAVAKSEDPSTILRAVRAVRAVRELSQNKREQSWPKLISALTPLLAFVVTAVTLIVQTGQVNSKAELEQNESIRKAMFEREQADYSEWREVIKNVSLSDPSSVQMGLFTLQGFLDPQSIHASDARSIAVTLLPLTSNE